MLATASSAPKRKGSGAVVGSIDGPIFSTSFVHMKQTSHSQRRSHTRVRRLGGFALKPFLHQKKGASQGSHHGHPRDCYYTIILASLVRIAKPPFPDESCLNEPVNRAGESISAKNREFIYQINCRLAAEGGGFRFFFRSNRGWGIHGKEGEGFEPSVNKSLHSISSATL